MKFLLSGLVFLSLIGCATEGKFRDQMKSWEGSDVNKLIEQWGPPTNTFKMPNGNTVYTYHLSNGSQASCAYGICNAAEVFCEANFTTDSSNKIVNWRYQGNNCRAK